MKSKYTALLLGWLVPGLGHAYAGKRWKAVIFFLAIYASTATGWAMGSFRNVYFSGGHYQFWAELGNGLFTLVVSVVMHGAGVIPIEVTSSGASLAGTLPIADLYLMLAGLLNFVVAANAYDVAALEGGAKK